MHDPDASEMRRGVRVLSRGIPWGSTRHGNPRAGRPEKGGYPRLFFAALRIVVSSGSERGTSEGISQRLR